MDEVNTAWPGCMKYDDVSFCGNHVCVKSCSAHDRNKPAGAKK